MHYLIDELTTEMGKAFETAGYDPALGRVQVSARPDLAQYQCNGAMAGAKKYHKAPFVIAQDVANALQASDILENVQVVKPGFINCDVNTEFLTGYIREMEASDHFGLETGDPKTVIIDYGGPNVAKPLHVGHLRSAVIGDSIKRIMRYHGDTVIGDIHLGDWGLQMGLVITELKKRHPELPYFDPNFTGEYPAEAPFTVSDLEEIYPFASKRSKEDKEYYAEALENTHRLQEKERGLYALWQKIIDVSVADLKKNYARLDVTFDLWNGESTVNDLIPGMVDRLKKEGYAYESEGALVVDVAEDSDAKEIPPCMILKSDGAALYTTTDLATIEDREARYNPDAIVYVTDKRQELHFIQVFRAAKKCHLADENCTLSHVGFGTVNGKDGHAFKTREGGVMRLETLITDIDQAMYDKIKANPDIPEDEAKTTAHQVALAAIKYGDLQNQPAKDYIFDTEKFTSFEGNTGPYLLYTMVRIKSILHRYAESEGAKDVAKLKVASPISKAQTNLMLDLSGFNAMMDEAYRDFAPNRVCAFLYQAANDFNSFYHETKILAEPDVQKKESYIALLKVTLDIFEACTAVLGFTAPERM